MPILENPRHERFAQGLAAGKSATEAYQAAGYAENRPGASRLATKANICSRVAELLQRSAVKVEITVEDLVREMDENRNLAFATKQSAGAVAATTGKAKLLGLMVERKQVVPTNELTDEQLDERIRQVTGRIAAEAGTARTPGDEESAPSPQSIN